jgi:hypothetical protein
VKLTECGTSIGRGANTKQSIRSTRSGVDLEMSDAAMCSKRLVRVFCADLGKSKNRLGVCED